MGRMGQIGANGTSQAQISTKFWYRMTECVAENYLISDHTTRKRFRGAVR